MENNDRITTLLGEILEQLETIEERLDWIEEKLANLNTPGSDYSVDEL